MTKKKRFNTSESSISLKQIRKSSHKGEKRAQAIKSQSRKLDNVGNPRLQQSDDIHDLLKSIVEEFSHIRKSDGLITGTNEVLRLLEKEKLTAVFMFRCKASNVIRNSLYKICREVGVPVIGLVEKDEHVLNQEISFPKSITYGIKKEPVGKSENLRSLLLQYSARFNKKYNREKAVSSTDNEVKLPPLEARPSNQEIPGASTCYHIYKDVSKKPFSKQTGFLSLNKFSTDEKETDFLDYDSVACSGVLSIK